MVELEEDRRRLELEEDRRRDGLDGNGSSSSSSLLTVKSITTGGRLLPTPCSGVSPMVRGVDRYPLSGGVERLVL